MRAVLCLGVLLISAGCAYIGSGNKPAAIEADVKQGAAANEMMAEKVLERAEKGDLNAQVLLGMLYYQGENVVKDHKKAFRWWRAAAEKGHATAQWRLASLYYRGEGVVKNLKKALSWYEKSAN
ncbi:MAG TPA: sel1 repeat family protein, partial [Rhodospirillales bacterium]|nr:sel1 repeat family protein [Rhodospirillales bacterium]